MTFMFCLQNKLQVKFSMENLTFENIRKYCRICLRNEAIIPIFTQNCEIRPIDMIVKLDLFKIDISHNFPTSLCQLCFNRLNDAFNLKQECLLTDFRLHEISKSPQQTGIGHRINTNLFKPCSFDHSGESIFYKPSNESNDTYNAESPTNVDSPSTNFLNSDNILDDVIIEVASISENDNSIVKEIENQRNVKDGSSVCNQKLGTKKGINKTSLNIRKRTLQMPEKCSICGKNFVYAGHLHTHMRTHSGEKPFQCQVCYRSFSQIGNLKLHMRIHANERRYQCEICSKMFITLSNLKSHRLTHSEKRNYACLECPMRFKTKTERDSHAGTHSGIKNHICTVCQKAFYKVSYLNIHMRTVHLGDKRYQCSNCGKVFSKSTNLKNHYRIHTGEKPYKCQICDARFNQSSALVRHTKLHEKIKPLDCVSLENNDESYLEVTL